MSNRNRKPMPKKARQNTKTSTSEANAAIKTPEKKEDAAISEVQGNRIKIKTPVQKNDVNETFFGGVETAMLYGTVMICAVGLLIYFVFVQ
ncbi:MAG: hypothetical protein LBP54_08460 [Campylobacteraceae bacterium]|jgi:hypothetical protein|nr:hypothetical protein [Campylobacteraceae bacterium]